MEYLPVIGFCAGILLIIFGPIACFVYEPTPFKSCRHCNSHFTITYKISTGEDFSNSRKEHESKNMKCFSCGTHEEIGHVERFRH